MDKHIQLLDCTLRDGGYINDWEFGKGDILNIYERLVDSKLDIVEIGFIDERRPYDANRTIFPDTLSIKSTLELTGKRPEILVGMIDYGTCAIENIEDAGDSILDGIRVIFKKHRMNEAMEFVGQLIEKGYKVFAQLVAISTYEEKDIEDISRLVNKYHPYAVSLVDTYGLLYPNDVVHYFEEMDKRVDKDIRIGFHAHNNLQLAYANTITFLNCHGNRNVIVDGTLFGMGKSAGNTPIEMLSPYVNLNFEGDYIVSQQLEAIEESVKAVYSKSSWGYKTPFYLSAEFNCHPNYVTFLINKGNLSMTDIECILRKLPTDDSRILYDKDIINNIYENYINTSCDDSFYYTKMNEEFGDRKVLIIGPGKNIVLQRPQVQKFISQENPIIISINYVPVEFKVDYVFATKKSRYKQMTELLLQKRSADEGIGLITVTGVEPRENPEFVFNREPLLEKHEEIMDNSFIMLLKILNGAKIGSVVCAGLDGYSDTEDNYYKTDMEYNFVKKVARRLNYHIRELINSEFSDMDIRFITYSHYEETEDADSGAF